MAVNLSPYGGVGAQFLDNAGNVLTGGKIFTYAAGTTTNQATYTSSTGTTFHPNPIILDASGRVPSGGEIWLTDGLLYKFVLETSTGVLIATYDNIAGINSNFVNFTNEQEIQTATAGQTVFTLATTNYSPGTNSLSVFVDGVNQYGPGAQYAYLETNSTTVTFVNGLHLGALVKFTTSQSNTSGGTNASAVVYDPPFTGSVPTTVENKLSATVSVTDFGAVGDGITDDTAAFNAAAQYIRDIAVRYFTLPQIVDYVNIALVIPAGTYNITSWNLTNIQIRNFFIMGEGSLIVGTANGKAVIDALGARWVHFNGISVTNASGVVPYCGIQVGRITALGAIGNNIYSQVTVNGNWSLAAYLNSTTETSGHTHCNYQNNIDDPASYAVIQDGFYLFPNVSDYVTVTRTPGEQSSFTSNSFFNCHIRHQGTGNGLFISNSSDHQFNKGCYFNSRGVGTSCVVIYQTSIRRNYNLTLDGMFEFADYTVTFDGNGTNSAIDNFYLNLGAARTNISAIHVANVPALTVRNGEIKVSFGNDLFDSTCSVIDWMGVINASDSDQVNSEELSKFTGTIYTNSFSNIGMPANGGSFTVYDQGAEKVITVVDPSNFQNVFYSSDSGGAGAILFFDGAATNVTAKIRAKNAGDVQIGNNKRIAIITARADDATTTTSLIAESKQNEFLLAVSGTETNVDLQLGTQGAGLVKFGTRTATSDAPITGYIEVKDSGGTIRKLAVIS
jgi:hypothetical protein